MSSSIQKRQDTRLVAGSYADPRQINAMLDSARDFNLVAPATSCGTLPAGFEVAISVVRVDPSESYSVGTKDKPAFGLAKTTLDQIGSALGVVADPHLSGRTDDGSDPHYYSYHWVGHVQNFDGTWRAIQGEKEMDLRDGSPQILAIIDRVAAANRKYGRNSSPDGQIRDMRLFIQAHAETKARLRALRSVGIKTSYTPEELRRPFAVARLVATGRCEDPELTREFSRMQFAAGIDARRAIFGGTPAPALRAAPAPQALHAPPPVGSVGADPDDFVAHHPDLVQAQGEAVPPSDPQQEAPSNPRNDAPPAWTIPGGKSKGTPLEKASDQDLGYWHNRVHTEIEEGTARYPDRAEAFRAALAAEMDRRMNDTY